MVGTPQFDPYADETLLWSLGFYLAFALVHTVFPFLLQMMRPTQKPFTWGYAAPIPECPKIENLLCFYDEKVDAVYVDGGLQPRPVTPWS